MSDYLDDALEEQRRQMRQAIELSRRLQEEARLNAAELREAREDLRQEVARSQELRGARSR